MATKKYLLVKDIAAELEVSEKTVRKLINEKQIVAYKLGREWRVTQDDFNDYLAKSKNI
ncbi:helix-turn-helix domain-containing protein [Lysinibacillus sp. NPDC047702]|uniref:helix-turn-helix domain-containing protein n=1 Tax=unclassified Lysinibacillus TaxID=2636778 RepID=UPI003CFC5249